MHTPTTLRALSVAATLTACRSSGPPAPTAAPSASSSAAAHDPAAPVAPTTPPPPPSTPTPAREASADDVRAAAHGLNQFGLDLYGRLRATQGNLAVAPGSLGLAFGMTAAGARADTLAEMRRVLHATLDTAPQAAALGALSSRWNADLEDGVTLRTANRLFGHARYTFDAAYLDLTQAVFRAPLERIDFAQPEPSRLRINAWVSEQTRDRIRDLLPVGSIDDQTRLVLVNAMYLLASWQHRFTEGATADAPFYVAGGAASPRPTMHQRNRLAYAQRAGYRVVELPYRGDALVMDMLLPDARDGLAALESSLTADGLDADFAALAASQVDVAMPKFRVETASLPLRAHLEALGMHQPFDRTRADFTAIANPPSPADRLYISQAFHKVFVDVTETGTEAAAATAVVMMRGGGMPMPPDVTFTADHPFLFVIRDRQNGAMLFVGRVVDPRPAR